jgi:hypothetical protein
VVAPRLALAVFAAALLNACGGDRTTSTETTAVDDVLSTTEATGVVDVVRSAGLDAKSALSTLCGGWETGHPDHQTVNSYVSDLLLPLDLVNGSNPPRYTSDDIDTVVGRACTEHPGDAAAFVDAVRTGLGLSLSDLMSRVTTACTRYREEQRRIAEGDWSGEDVDPWMVALAVSSGVNETQLRSAIETLCP